MKAYSNFKLLSYAYKFHFFNCRKADCKDSYCPFQKDLLVLYQEKK